MQRKSASIKITSLTNQAVITDKCHVAESFLDRLRGLIGRSSFEQGSGVLFPKCNSIHMWFMRFSIDVVFIRNRKNADGTLSRVVSSAHESVRAWRPHPLFDLKASDTLELPVGTIRRHGIVPGDELCIS